MRRRTFITTGATGILGMGVSGCSAIKNGGIEVKQEYTPFEFDKKVPKPKGTMPMAEIGSTGIRVSKFGFGSHIRRDIRRFETVRESMVREAFDLGINFFDVYDYEGRTFQYEPMGRYLKPMKKDVVISITSWPFDGRTVEQELVRVLRLFGRDYIDMARIHAWKNTEDQNLLALQLNHRWEWWEQLFKLREKGYVRAVGVPVHNRNDLAEPLAELPIDFVIFPYNFYHNWTWMAPDQYGDTFDSVIPKLREKGIGVISMKPFAGDALVTPFKRLAAQFDVGGEVNFAKACLKYVINSGRNVDATLGGMYNPYHLHENVDAFFNPRMSDNERMVLKKIRETARVVAGGLLPEHYHFLEDWVPDSWDDTDLFGYA